jgi:hypothetical protein
VRPRISMGAILQLSHGEIASPRPHHTTIRSVSVNGPESKALTVFIR